VAEPLEETTNSVWAVAERAAKPLADTVPAMTHTALQAVLAVALEATTLAVV